MSTATKRWRGAAVGVAGTMVAVALAVFVSSTPDVGSSRNNHRLPDPSRGTTAVGAPGPALDCSRTLDSGANVALALTSARPGSVICLSGGSWPNPMLTGVAPASNVTLTAVPGQTVFMAGLTMKGPGAVENLTIQGLHFTSSVRGLDAISGGLVFKYDTFKYIAGDYAFYFYGDGEGTHAAQTGVSILYSQIDHVGECLEIVGGARKESHFTFSHNVCGPGLGYQEAATFGAHYIQSDGVDTLTVANNAFEGPPDPRTVTYHNHLNVLHIWGSAQNVDFSNNIVWHAREIAQMLLLGDTGGPSLLNNITIANNLEVTDPACGPGSDCHAYSMYSFPAHAMTWTHNTIVGSVWGVGLGWRSGCTSTCYGSSTNMTGTNNLAASSCGTVGDCNHDYTAFSCVAACTVAHNVSADASAGSALGGSGNVTRWMPRFRSTSWSPRSGSPWEPPPAGYYVPLGLPFAAGYPGAIGP